jgi:hypothetical protein
VLSDEILVVKVLYSSKVGEMLSCVRSYLGSERGEKVPRSSNTSYTS